MLMPLAARASVTAREGDAEAPSDSPAGESVLVESVAACLLPPRPCMQQGLS